MDRESIAIVISLFSLVVSVWSFIVSRRAFERDRSDLRLRVEYHAETDLGSAFRVILVNHGRRAVTVEEVRLRLKSGRKRSYADLSSRNANLQTGAAKILYGFLTEQYLMMQLH